MTFGSFDTVESLTAVKCDQGPYEDGWKPDARQWADQNAELVKAYTVMTEKQGLPLDRYRTF